jgi:MoaA/NifB/PqqE/SkfB family radical SAM enzyme
MRLNSAHLTLSEKILQSVTQALEQLIHEQPQAHLDVDTHTATQKIAQSVTSACAPDSQYNLNTHLTTLPTEARNILVVPINISSVAFLAVVTIEGDVYHTQLNEVGKGNFILGDDNTTFGKWDALVAHSPAGQIIDIFPGHGGEIIPGKLHDHIERLRKNIESGQRLPVQMDIDISMACASKCTFCFSAKYRSSRRNQLIMDSDLMLDLIRNWADLGIKVVRFDGGGDPLTHPQLLEGIRLANSLGMQTAVLTSGDLLNEQQIETFVSCQTYVRISLNAGNDTTRLLIHQPIHNKFDLSHILEEIHRLADLRLNTYGNRAKQHMLLGATSMVHPRNYKDTFKIAKNAKEVGFDHLSFRVILGNEHAVHFSDLMLSELEKNFERIRLQLVDEDFDVFFPTRALTDTGYNPKEFFHECLACTHRVLIEVGHRADRAAAVPCGRYRGNGFRWSPENESNLRVLGHFEKAVPIQSIWMTPHMHKMIKSFPQACEDCIDRSANLFFGRINSILSYHSDARFLKFARG